MTESSSPMPHPEPVSRRGLIARLVLAATAGVVAFRGTPAAAAPALTPKLRVVYHLADRDKVQFVLGNIGNHFAGVEPSEAEIALVVHGPALMEFQLGKASPDLRRQWAELASLGLKPGACGNTLRAQKLTVDELLPGFAAISEGGVVRLAALQLQGWAYLRP